MTSTSFVIVLDIPSIKQFVFGTDALTEVRGASALLNWLNRQKMEHHLGAHLEVANARVESIYANGGSAQFIVRGCPDAAVRAACTSLVQQIGKHTCGEVRVVFGMAPLENEAAYREAVRTAHFQLRCQREFSTCHRSATLMPLMMECQSASHLPAARLRDWGAEGTLPLSEASHQKRCHGRYARHHGLWPDWMRHLEATGPWPPAQQWEQLRCESLVDIGEQSSRRNDIGLVYADGNAMGQIVQALDRPETFRLFSQIVDGSIREACFLALSHICRPHIADIRKAVQEQARLKRLPADILLLGGDDLLVAVPADLGLDFALKVTDEFERLTREKLAAIPDAEARHFFRDRLGARGFTISCGVAISKSTYPFYLLFNLAEQLLKNAKRYGNRYSPPRDPGAAPVHIDFHVVAGANSHALKQVREDAYQVKTDAQRTLRPLSRTELETLRTSVQWLRQVGFPRSKLHQLQDAALTPATDQADWRMRDLFSRCPHTPERSQRRTLWRATQHLCPEGYTFDFPWFTKDHQRLLGIADLVEAYDLFPP
ncbi:hypothetical protein NKDENANG_00756 [Candidatus Entotheonellaceae bacterium PAL068K]